MRTCPNCLTPCTAAAKFCAACGALLAQETGAQEHRKVVTVGSVDLVDSVGLGQRLDPESPRAVLLLYFGRSTEVLTRHGGTFEKFIGDAVVAVFGISTLREEQPDMTTSRPTRPSRAGRWAFVPAVLVVALLVGGCGGGGESKSSVPTQEKNASLHDQLPEAIQSAGKVEIGTEALYPPFEAFAKDNKTIVGFDPDLANALGQVLGIDVTMKHTAFDGLLTALDGGRFDLVMAAITDTTERQAKYDFVDYFTTGQAIVVRKGNPEKITTIEDLCGKNVSVLVASTQEKLLGEFNADMCASDKIKVTALPNDRDALLQVRTGRTEASFTQDAVGRYNSRTIGGGNQFEVANSEPVLPVPVGIVFGKGDTELRDAFKAALEDLIANGTYDEILEKNDLSGGANKDAEINGGTS